MRLQIGQQRGQIAGAGLAGLSDSVTGIVGWRAVWGLGNALFIATALATIVMSARGSTAQAIILFEAALGLGIAAAHHGHRVLFATATEWVTRLTDAHHAYDAREQARNTQESLNLARARLKAGTAAAVEVQQAEVQAQQATLAVQQAQGGVWQALAALSVASGVDVTGLVPQ